MAGARTEVVELGGKKVLLINGRIVQRRADVQRRIERLDGAIKERLPAFRARLDARELLEKAWERVDRRIEALKAVKAELEAQVGQLDD